MSSDKTACGLLTGVIYEEPWNEEYKDNIEFFKYSIGLAMTSTIRGNSEKPSISGTWFWIYSKRRWMRAFSLFFCLTGYGVIVPTCTFTIKYFMILFLNEWRQCQKLYMIYVSKTAKTFAILSLMQILTRLWLDFPWLSCQT